MTIPHIAAIGDTYVRMSDGVIERWECDVPVRCAARDAIARRQTKSTEARHKCALSSVNNAQGASLKAGPRDSAAVEPLIGTGAPWSNGRQVHPVAADAKSVAEPRRAVRERSMLDAGTCESGTDTCSAGPDSCAANRVSTTRGVSAKTVPASAEMPTATDAYLAPLREIDETLGNFEWFCIGALAGIAFSLALTWLTGGL